MSLLLNFLWVLGVEYFQNLPCILGIVFAWAGFKSGLVWWKWLLILLIGNFGCAILIVAMDRIKLLPTTLTSGSQDLANIIRMGTIFSVASGLLLLYFALTTKLRKPFWADVVFGVIVAVLIAVVETLGNFAPSVILMHALGFAAAGACLVTLIRRSADLPPGRDRLIRVGLITLVMSVLIVIFDYLPHLRG